MFEEILGLTKPLSDNLQAENLSLCHAIELVKLSQGHWKRIVPMSTFEMASGGKPDLAKERSVNLEKSTLRRATQLPTRLNDAIVFETTGSQARASTQALNGEAKYRRIYFDVMDKVQYLKE